MSIFIPSQIVCLDSPNYSLYCEVIEIITSRFLCWVRPVILVNKQEKKPDYLTDKTCVYDLRFTSDLLWKIDDFRIVLDTEYIEFFADLQDFEFEEDKLAIAQQKLRLFIQEILTIN